MRDKIEIKYPFPLEDVPHVLRKMVSKIEMMEAYQVELEEKIEQLEEKIDYQSKLNINVGYHNATERSVKFMKYLNSLDAKAFWDSLMTPAKTPNQKRKELIEEAKRIVSEELTGDAIEFYVDRTNRTVECASNTLLKAGGRIVAKRPESRGYALCSPDDVFNEDLGKLISGFRMMGKEIPEKFLDPVQPNKLVKGAELFNRKDIEYSFIHVDRIERTESGKAWVSSYSYTHEDISENGIFHIDDTNAEYEL